MTLIALTVVVIAVLIAVLAIYLFVIGVLLNRTAGNLDDCAQNVKKIRYQAEVIGPGIKRINETGGTVVGALPLLCEGAEGVAVAKSAPYVDSSEAPRAVPTPVPAAPRDSGYQDGGRGSVGYLDAGRGSVGYLDA